MRTATRAIGMSLALAAALFLLLETTARLYLFGWHGLVPARINSVHGLPLTGFVMKSSQPGLGFELAPDIDDYFKLASFKTNGRGLRDREYPQSKADNVFRVAVLGSSFALPAGVEIEDAFHSLLEFRLSERSASTRYEFINFSVGMYNPNQLLTMLETRALDYEPDLVLFCVTRLAARALIDPEDWKREGIPGKQFPELASPIVFQRSYPILQSFFLRLARLRLQGGNLPAGLQIGVVERAVMKLFDAGGAKTPEPVASHWPAKTQRIRGGTLPERIVAIRDEYALPIAVIRLEFDPAPADPVDAFLARWIPSHGLPYFDTRAAFEGTRPRDFWIYELDPHPNAAAHEIFSRAIGTFLASEGLIPMESVGSD